MGLIDDGLDTVQETFSDVQNTASNAASTANTALNKVTSLRKGLSNKGLAWFPGIDKAGARAIRTFANRPKGTVFALVFSGIAGTVLTGAELSVKTILMVFGFDVQDPAFPDLFSVADVPRWLRTELPWGTLVTPLFGFIDMLNATLYDVAASAGLGIAAPLVVTGIWAAITAAVFLAIRTALQTLSLGALGRLRP